MQDLYHTYIKPIEHLQTPIPAYIKPITAYIKPIVDVHH